MAIFNPVDTPVISKVTIGDKVYYLKDAEARELLAQLGTAAKKDVAAGVSADEQGLVTGAQVQAAIANISGAMHFIGAITGDTFDEALAAYKTEHPDYKEAAGDVVVWGVKEYVYDGAAWQELGDESLYALKSTTIGTQTLAANINLETLATDMGLGALSKKDSAKGTVDGQTISGLKASGTSTGSIAVALTQTSTDATVTKADYTPAGDVAGSVVAEGTVAIAKSDSGTQISGSVSAPEVTVTPATDSIKKVTSVGTLPSKAADTFTANGDDTFTQGSQAAWSANVNEDTETLSFSFTANTLPTFVQGAKATFSEGAFSAGTLPELAETGTTVVTGISKATATAPVFTGDKFGATFTGSSADITATFTGEKTSVVDSVKYDKAGVDSAATKFTGAAIELDVADIVVTAKEVTVS